MILRLHLSSVRMTKIYKTDNKCLQGWGVLERANQNLHSLLVRFKAGAATMEISVGNSQKVKINFL